MAVHSATVPRPDPGEMLIEKLAEYAAIAMLWGMAFGIIFGAVKLVKWIWNF